ncbi:hypothetical protein [Streptococcus suis]
MVSDWQGGDISKLFPALSGKEDLSMGEDKKADKKRKRIVPKAPVQMIISREYVGTQTVTEAFVPIISEDIRKKRRLPRATPSTMRGCPLRMYAMGHENR